MPHNQAQWITHVIDGGWATDHGNTFYATPSDGELRIPWCKTCENVKFFPDGSWGKYPGLERITASAPIKAPRSSTGVIESSVVQNIYDYVSFNGSDNGSRIRVVIVGSYLYDISSSDEPVLIGDVLFKPSYPMHMTTFNDLLIIGGGFSPTSWDQTTFQTLAGTPPAFGFSTPHAGRHWASGNSSAPSRLYYSAVGNPEDWVGAGSGSIDIDPGDGDKIVALLSWKRELWVFKGPYRLSIHRITGTSPADFSREPFITGISASGQNSIFPLGNDFGFWSPRGSCHSLTTTANYGDYEQSYINYPILSWCRNPANITNGFYSNTWQAVTDFSQNTSYTILNNNSSLFGTPQLMVMDWKFKTPEYPYPRFIKLNLGKFSSLAITSGVFDNSQLLPTFGNVDGVVFQEFPQNVNLLTNDSNAFDFRVETPPLTYGPSVYTKTVYGVSIDLVPNTNQISSQEGDINYSLSGRGVPAQTITFNSSTFARLGSFVLGTDQLGGEGNYFNVTESINGESKAFTHTFVGVGGTSREYARVQHFGVLFTSSGESMENS